MLPDASTHSGDDTAHTVSSAAEAISGLLGDVSPPEKTEEQTQQAQDESTLGESEGDESGQERAESQEEKSDEAGKEDDAAPSLETLEELAERTGLPLETILNLKAKAKVDGVESTVPIAEVLQSYQLQSHARNQIREIEESRKAFEAERETQKAELTANLQRALLLANADAKEIEAEYNKVDWEALRQRDSNEYLIKQHEYSARYQRAMARANAANQELQTLEQQRLQEHTKIVNAERAKWRSVVPEWADDAKYEAEKGEIVSYLRSNGFKDQEIADIYDSRAIKLIRNAMLYEKASKGAKLAEKKVANLKPVLKPGAQASKADAKRDAAKEHRERLRKTGNIRDAAAAIGALMK